MTRLISPTAKIIRQWEAEWDTNGAAHCDKALYIAAKSATWGAKAAIECALRDTASCHWRVADGPEDGVQQGRKWTQAGSEKQIELIIDNQGVASAKKTILSSNRTSRITAFCKANLSAAELKRFFKEQS